jgi:hypothetical protein
MNLDPEFDQWQAAWTSTAGEERAPAFDARGAHRRQERHLRLQYAANLAVAAALMLFAACFLHANYSAEVLVWTAVVWLTTLVAAGFHVWNWRSLWRGAGQSVLEYAESYEQRCHASLRAVRFGYALLALQVAIALPWLTWDFANAQIPAGRYAAGVGVLAALSAAFVAWFRAVRRRANRGLAEAMEFRRGLTGGAE